MAARETVLDTGQQVGQLRILKLLGRGAFGRVYLAEDMLIGRRVALKVVPTLPGAEGGLSDDAILREARAIGRLSHPGIVTLYRVHPVGREQLWMFEMEFVEGGSLRDLLGNDRALAPDRAMDIARGIAAAVDAAHAAGVVHGDLKPENVLLRLDGGVKLADFGLARILGDLTATLGAGQLAGTPLYMAPEVIVGEPPTQASDMWSFGVLCYRMLSGKFPFRGETLPGLFYAIQGSDPEPLVHGWPGEFAEVRRCLEKDPARRPSEAAELLGRRPAGRPARAAPRPAKRLPGREKELQRLEEAWRGGAPGRGVLVLFSGEAGIGKSTLLRAFRGVLEAEGVLSVEAADSPFRGLAHSLLAALRVALEKRGLPLDASGRNGIAAEFARRILDGILGLSDQNRVQTVVVLEQLLAAAASRFRTAVYIEDAHLADEEDAHVLLHLGRRLPAIGCSLLVAGRTHEGALPAEERRGPSALAEFGTLDEIIRIEVGPLSKEACYEALAAAIAPKGLDPGIADRIYSRTQGNPLFALELLRHLEATGALEQKDGKPGPGSDWGSMTLPRRFHDAVALRLAGLGPEDRGLLDAAAVDGPTFDGEALAAVCDRPLLTLLRDLQRLSRETGLVAPSIEGYRFTSAVIQNVIYGDLAPELRKTLHLGLARHLEERPPEARAAPERLGLHWERAGEPARARPHLLRAARAAASRQEIRRQVDLCERAGFVPERLTVEEALREHDLLRTLVYAYHDAGMRARANGAAEKLLDAARAARDEMFLLRAQVSAAELRYFTQGVEAADESTLRRAAEELPPCYESGQARYLLGVIMKYRGRLEEAGMWLRRADDVFRELGNHARRSSTLDQVASVRLRAGQVREAEDLYREAARISADLGRRANAATSEVNRVLAAMSRGALEGLEDPLVLAIQTLDVEGARNLAAHAGVCLATLRYALGDTRAAYDTAVEACAVVNETGYLPGLAYAGVQASQLASALGRLDEARAHLAAGREAARREEDSEGLAHAFAQESQLLWFEGDPIGGAEAARRSVALAAETAESRLVSELGISLAEAAVLGLPGAAAEAGRLPLRPLGAVERDRIAGAAVAGVRSMADEAGGVEALRAAAVALRGQTVGEKRAALRVCADRLEAEAFAREGDPASAEEAARRGLDAARALGHVWHAAALLRFLRRIGRGSDAAQSLDRLLGPVLDGIADSSIRRRARDAWLGCDG